LFSFSGVAIVAAVAFLVPLLLGLIPQWRLPSAVLEIVAGIVIGPSVLGWVKDDISIQQLAPDDHADRLGSHRHGFALLALVPWRGADDSGPGGENGGTGGGSVAVTCALSCSLRLRKDPVP
jgi:hypothetical protein